MYQKSAKLISQIQKLEGDIHPLVKFFSHEEVKTMITWSQECFQANQGNSFRLQDQKAKNNDQTGSPQGALKEKILEYLHQKIGPIINPDNQLDIEFDIAFHANKKPYGIHTDSGYDPSEFIYKQGIIPLINEPNNKKTHTVIMKQKCYHSSSFPHIAKDNEAQKDILGLDFKNFIATDTYKIYWNQSQERKNQMFGFTIDYPFEWQVGDTVIWDRSRVHCSSDFEATGVNFKLGLMWISRVLNYSTSV